MANRKRIGEEIQVRLPSGKVMLDGQLSVPQSAQGIILFAHGSGSSRFSPRNMFVSDELREAGFGTLLFDLLTSEEEEVDQRTAALRFDIKLLTERLVSATDWIKSESNISNLNLGYFGASTGAAAALAASAARPEAVKAIVSRGGRPDLAGATLPMVRAPTLLIVGGNDFQVIELNRQAAIYLNSEKELAVIPGATHLFEEPGKLEEVSRLAIKWFTKYLITK